MRSVLGNITMTGGFAGGMAPMGSGTGDGTWNSIKVGDGTAAAPSYSFTGSTAVGFYREGSGVGVAATSFIIGAAIAGNSGLEIGSQTVSSTPFIDFHSGAVAVDYDARLIAAGGIGVVAGGTLALDALAFRAQNNGVTDLGVSAIGFKRLYMDYTNTATVGAVTINKAAGRVRIAAAGSSVVVTNSLVTAASKVFCTIATNDATAVLKNVVPAAGSFTITLNAATTAETAIDFFVVNAD